MIIMSYKDIPGVLLKVVPESRDGILAAVGKQPEELLESDIERLEPYVVLSHVFYQGVLLPELQKRNKDKGLLRRCFKFIETIVTSPVQSIRSSGAFDLIEPLFANERLVVASFPLMGTESLRIARDTLDPDRISQEARREIAEYL